MKISKYYRNMLRTFINHKNRKNLVNKEFSIIASNCVGGVITHELGMRFNSPTVNCWFRNEEFVCFCENLKHYIFDCELYIDDDKSRELGYPVGKLENISIYFLHYKSFEEAKAKWDARKQRIKWDNIYLTMVQSPADGDDLVARYLSLPYPKVYFVAKKDDDNGKELRYLENSVEDGRVVDLCRYENKFTGKRLIDKFDYVSFLNEKK